MFSFSSIKNYQTELINGQTTCVEAVLFFLEQVKTNKHLNAFLEVYSDEALKRAQELDNLFKQTGQLSGSLHGVVISIKDVISHKGHNLSASSKILENFKAIYNATAVERILEQGAIIIGRNNCDEFAMGSSNENSAFGNVLNAKDTSRVPGGSSGGSAVAVQANMCMASLGSDTGGSVRQPADFCGIVGFKPSYGMVSRHGLIAYASSFDQIGIFTRNVSDSEIILKIISGPDDFDSTVLNQKATETDCGISLPQFKETGKIGYFQEALESPFLDNEIKGSILGTLEKLSKQGFDVQPIKFELFDHIVPAYYILTTAEAASNLSRFDGVRFCKTQDEKTLNSLNNHYEKVRSEGFGKEVKRRIMLGNFVLSTGYYDAYFTKAQQVRTLLNEKINEIFQTFQFLISPTVPSTAFRIGEKSNDPVAMFLADIYTVFSNLTGIPAISIPLYTHTNGLPFGLQVMSFNKNDLALLNFSEYVMASRKMNSA